MPMERRRKVLYKNRQVEAIEVPVKSSGEFWNEYMLEDGTVIRVKVVMTDVMRVEDEYDEEGAPAYDIKTTMISSVSVPEHLRRKEEQ